MAVYPIFSNITAAQTAPSSSGKLPVGSQMVSPLSQNNPNSPAANHAFALTVTGAVGDSATCQALGSNDGINWDNYGATFTATIGPSGVVGIKTQSGTTPYNFVSGIVTAVSGTRPSASLNVSA